MFYVFYVASLPFVYFANIIWILLVLLMMYQRLVKDFYKILNQVNTEEIPDGLKHPDSFSQLVSEMKNNQYDARTFAFMLRAMVCCNCFSVYLVNYYDFIFPVGSRFLKLRFHAVV